MASSSSSSITSKIATENQYERIYIRGDKQHKFTLTSPDQYTEAQLEEVFNKSLAAANGINTSQAQTTLRYHYESDKLKVDEIEIDGKKYERNDEIGSEKTKAIVRRAFSSSPLAGSSGSAPSLTATPTAASTGALSTSTPTATPVPPAPGQPPKAKSNPVLDLLKNRDVHDAQIQQGSTQLDALATQLAAMENDPPSERAVKSKKIKIHKLISETALKAGKTDPAVFTSIFTVLKDQYENNLGAFNTLMENYKKSRFQSKMHTEKMDNLATLLNAPHAPTDPDDRRRILEAYAYYITQEGAVQGDLWLKLFEIAHPEMQLVIVDSAAESKILYKSPNINQVVDLRKCLFMQRNEIGINGTYGSLSRSGTALLPAINRKAQTTVPLTSEIPLTVGFVKSNKTSLTNAVSESVFGRAHDAQTQKQRAQLLRNLADSNIEHHNLSDNPNFQSQVLQALKKPEVQATLATLADTETYHGISVAVAKGILSKEDHSISPEEKRNLALFYRGYIADAGHHPLDDAFMTALGYVPTPAMAQRLRDAGIRTQFENGIHVVKLKTGADPHSFALDSAPINIQAANAVYVWFNNIDYYEAVKPNTEALQAVINRAQHSLLPPTSSSSGLGAFSPLPLPSPITTSSSSGLGAFPTLPLPPPSMPSSSSSSSSGLGSLASSSPSSMTSFNPHVTKPNPKDPTKLIDGSMPLPLSDSPPFTEQYTSFSNMPD